MQITLTFSSETHLNSSLQVGDTVWYVATSATGGYNVAPKENVVKLGRVEEISSELQQRVVKISNYAPQALTSGPNILDTNSFLMFSKNNKANIGGLKGYYAQVNLTNNSDEKIELYSVSSEIVQSSK
tara:strand:+ start:84 stop:467 length:384 start_codon:yes stop_codon:yes gene_type:complete